MQAKVSAPTRAGRALRRSLLKGCVVVIVVAGYSGKRFVYERAHELGIRSACLRPFTFRRTPQRRHAATFLAEVPGSLLSSS